MIAASLLLVAGAPGPRLGKNEPLPKPDTDRQAPKGPFVIGGHRVPAASPRSVREFHDAPLAATTYLAWDAPWARGTQHFCVVAYDRDQDDRGAFDRVALVHWIEGRRLIVWEPQDTMQEGQDTALVMSRRDWDMVRDVQDNPDPYRMTDWIVERSWVDLILADCARVGQKFAVTVPAPGTAEAASPRWRPRPPRNPSIKI